MSTFDGLIREFPSVAIDQFRVRPGVCIYLLSHVHSDHLAGLGAKTWDAPIYCSQVTAKWLPMLASRSKQVAFESGQDRILYRKPLSTDVPHYLDLRNGRQARLSLIPAHHCPGAVMFLLQDDRSCILYTGDARNEAIDLQGLSAMPIFTASTQRIDRLYLDTTCCHLAFREFPSREFAVSDLVTFINRRPRLAHYYIDAWTFGYEDIWIGLARAFHTKIHVSLYLYELYSAIDDMIYPKILPHLTLDGTSARFHSCRLGKTCGYGGAGGEHSSSRKLIRIQPNVSWFSPLLRKERDGERDDVIAQGTVVGRSNSFKIKEKLPPSIGKKDDLCYYINYGCHASLSELQQLVKLVAPRSIFPCVLHRDTIFHSLYKSNREIIALLAQNIPPSDRSFLSYDVEEYKDRRPCFADGITTDFQSFGHVKGFRVLDMNDELHGISSAASLAQSRRLSQKKTPSTPMAVMVRDPSPILSPRSSHLRKKLDKLKRQLRNTASLEEKGVVDDGEESTLEEGPLSLDLEAIERKRKWWLETERGQSTTLEEQTSEEGMDLQSSGISSGGPGLRGEVVGSVASIAGDGRTLEAIGAENVSNRRESWYDQSTQELEPTILALTEEDDYERRLYDSRLLSIDSEAKGYLSSSPDPITNSDSWTDRTSVPSTYPGPSVASLPSPPLSTQSTASPAPQSGNLEIDEGNAEEMTRGAADLLLEPETTVTLAAHCITVSSDPSLPSSFGTPPYCVLSLLTPIPRTPPQSTTIQDREIHLGESPSTIRDHPSNIVLPPPISGPIQAPGSYSSTSFSTLRHPHEPIRDIFAQLTWSPPTRTPRRHLQSKQDPAAQTGEVANANPKPKRPIAELIRAQTDPRHGPGQELKRHFSILKRPQRAKTTVEDDGREFILIESSDEDGAGGGLSVLQAQREKNLKKRQKEDQVRRYDVSRRLNCEDTELMKRARALESQDLGWLEYEDFELDSVSSLN